MNGPSTLDVRPLNETEARALTERIKSTAEHLWALLLEAHERKAYKALGYGTWTAYIEAEFEIKRGEAYYLVQQGQVIREIEAASGLAESEVFTAVNMRTARDIKPLLPEVTNQIRERIARGEEPEDAVRETVAVARRATTASAPRESKWSRNQGRADLQVATVVRNLKVVAESLASFDPGEYRATEKEIEGLDLVIKALRQFRRSLVKE